MRLFIWIVVGGLVIWAHDKKEGKEAATYMATVLLWPLPMLYYWLWIWPRQQRRRRKKDDPAVLGTSAWWRLHLRLHPWARGGAQLGGRVTTATVYYDEPDEFGALPRPIWSGCPMCDSKASGSTCERHAEFLRRIGAAHLVRSA